MSHKRPFNYESFHDYLEVLIARDVISDWVLLGPGHYRISGKLDVWPRNRKFGYNSQGKMGNFMKHGNYTYLEKLITRLQFGLQK